MSKNKENKGIEDIGQLNPPQLASYGMSIFKYFEENRWCYDGAKLYVHSTRAYCFSKNYPFNSL